MADQHTLDTSLRTWCDAGALSHVKGRRLPAYVAPLQARNRAPLAIGRHARRAAAVAAVGGALASTIFGAAH
jgi:hypothetical protein